MLEDVAKQALVLGLTVSALGASPLDAIIRPGTIPVDIEGNEIHAHDAGMFQEGDTYYWYGCTKKVNRGDWLSDGVNVYSSTDFQHWRLLGKVFNADQITGTPWGTGPPWRLERPKIIFNKATGYYVLLFHLDDVPFSLTAVGIAKSKKIEGPFKWVGWVKPGGKRSYDMTAFVDDDGMGYLVNSVENEYVGIWPLSDDYLDVLGDRPCGKGPRGEGPAVFKTNATAYHMLASHLTGWDPNPEQLFNYNGKNPCGTWVATRTPPQAGPGSNTTWNSQSTYVFPLVIEGETLFIYMGDRWNYRGPGSLDVASYVWLPLLPTSGPGAEPGGFVLVANVEDDNKTLMPWSPREYLGKTINQPKGQAAAQAEADGEASRWAAPPTAAMGRASGWENYIASAESELPALLGSQWGSPARPGPAHGATARMRGARAHSANVPIPGQQAPATGAGSSLGEVAAQGPATSDGAAQMEGLGLLQGQAPSGKPAPEVAAESEVA